MKVKTKMRTEFRTRSAFFALSLCVTLTDAILYSPTAKAISERGYEETYRMEVLPYFNRGEYIDFAARDGLKLRAWRLLQTNERGALVILPGQGEPLVKYAEVAYDLRNQGYSVYLIDHRGQGASARMTKDPHVQYVENFESYADDLETFMDQIVNQTPHAKRFLLAHSMGGAIASLYLERHPGVFDAAVLSSPMELINTSPYSEPIAIAIAEAATFAGLGKCYSIGQRPYNPTGPVSESQTTSSEARHLMNASVATEYPDQVIKGVSFHWVGTSLETGRKIRAEADRVSTPVLLFQAGADTIVTLRGQDEFCEKAQACRIDRFPEARHEILMERDPIRDRAFQAIADFFNRF